jgi:Zn-dependent protease
MVKNGALKVVRIAGVDVYVHWSWIFLVYIYSQNSSKMFSSPWWIAAQIAAFIVMVGIHEGLQIAFGRMAGGRASEAYLSFLGRGSNLVPPQRPGPIMLTYFGGILAYAAMLGLTGSLFFATHFRHLGDDDLAMFAFYCLIVNGILLIWAALPVYPLDGGKILRAFLWLFMGKERSLQVACFLGLIGVVGVIAALLYFHLSFWWWISVVLIIMQCINGFKQAKLLGAVKRLPKVEGVVCPHCHEQPHIYTLVTCSCGQQMNPFETRGLCPQCGGVTTVMDCPHCFQRSSIVEWFGPTGLFEVQATLAPANTTGNDPGNPI